MGKVVSHHISFSETLSSTWSRTDEVQPGRTRSSIYIIYDRCILTDPTLGIENTNSKAPDVYQRRKILSSMYMI